MPVASGLLESTALRHIPHKSNGRLRNVSLSSVSPPADRRKARGSLRDGKLYAERCENVPLGRRSTRAAELNSRAPCQDEGGAERERKSQAEKTRAKVLRQEQA